ncbi:amidohydrolase family protein [Roseomonas sp. CAU 1739]|uniref:amidohydrolase n=1 Tax=Roseomonas sp. CAU 1739 TaxID=3140364 RepID=UPI00325B2356
MDAIAADLILTGGKVLTVDDRFSVAQAVAVRDGRILAVGPDAAIERHRGPRTEEIALAGRTMMPGLIDGHAHMDRAGLRQILPSLSGCRSIADVQARISDIGRSMPPGAWIVTMPLGEPPFYRDPELGLAEGRWPTRQELDEAAPHNPVYIKPIWGYWRHTLPLVSVANSRALALAGIGRDTVPPSAGIEIDKDATGNPTGIFREQHFMPLVELSLLRMAPGFTVAERAATLPSAAAAYHAFGTTSVYEGHGVAAEVLQAYRQVHEAGRLTMRSNLVFSPDWRGVEDVDADRLVEGWAHWLSGRGLGDDMLRVGGLITEIGRNPDNAIRAAAPTTGWAGFNYDMGLPRDRAKAVLVACARRGIRVTGIWPDMLALFAEVDRIAPIGGLRWVLGHIAVLTRDQVGLVRDLGLVVTTHTNRYIAKEGHLLKARHGLPDEEAIVPLRALRDAGVPVSLATDNVPISLWHPVAQAVTRMSTAERRPIAEAQALTREEALRAVTNHGALLTMEEDRKGSIEPGKLADFAVLTADPMTVPDAAIAGIEAAITIVGGRVVHRVSEAA